MPAELIWWVFHIHDTQYGAKWRLGRLKFPHFAHSLDQSDIDLALNLGKLQTLSISE